MHWALTLRWNQWTSISLLFSLLCALNGPGLASNRGVTLSHIYKIDVAESADCKLTSQLLPTQDQALELQDTSETVSLPKDNDVVFRHNILLQAPKCSCEDSENFKALLYRISGLEEEVAYLKKQCSQGCCSARDEAVDYTCSGHGTYQHSSCSCLCYAGWEGPDCSTSTCPSECNDNGRCVDGHCVCYEGYGGEDCSLLVCPNDCNDKGHCKDGICMCFSHYTGEDCSIPRCPGDCEGNGRCVDGTCVCNEGFFGEDCARVMGPQDLRLVQKSEESLLVEWDPITGVEYYVLTYYPEGDEGNLQRVRIPHTDTSYLIAGLSPGVTYIVDVNAVIKQITSEPGTIKATTVSSVDDIRVLGQTEDTIQIDWQNPAAELDYFKLTHANPEGHEEELTVPKSQEARTKHTIVGLYPGTEYLITVQAIKGSDKGKASSVSAVTDLDAPTKLVTTEVTEDTATVTWGSVLADVDGYTVSYSSADGSSEEIPVAPDSTSYRLTGLRPGVQYTVYVWGVKGSQVSKKSSTQTETELDMPTNLVTTEVTEDTATVTWGSVLADVDGYTVSYSSADGSSEEIPVAPDSTSYRLTGLRPGVQYTVYVWGVKGSQVSKKSSTQTETEIDAPTNLQASNVQLESADITWTAPQADIDGYDLMYRAADGSGQVVKQQLAASETRLSLTDLMMGNKYLVNLKAYKGSKTSRLVDTLFTTVGLTYPFPKDCTQVLSNGMHSSGIYLIYVINNRSKPIQVYCDMTTDGGGWIVFQRRRNGKLDFMKRWKQYIQGFGNLTDEFWLGLEHIYELTNTPTQFELRVDLKLGSESAYAVYDNFRIAPVKEKFALTVGKYRGTAGDALTYHNGRPFSTVDLDNDISLNNCALTHRGAWWYKNCHLANLNGSYGDKRHSVGLNWEPWKGHLVSLDATEMKIRPVGYVGVTMGRKRRSLGGRNKSRKMQLK